jgi:hypothetical protein
MPAAATLTGSETFPVVQVGVNKQVSLALIQGFMDALYMNANRLDTDVTLSANSDTLIATQRATKAYADQLIAANDAMVFKGVINCSGMPDYPAADRGHTYRVSVAGVIGGHAGLRVEVGDLLICLTDFTPSGGQGFVGSEWTITQANIDGAVIGPASATDGAIALFSGIAGKLLQDSSILVSALAQLATANVFTNQQAVTPYRVNISGVVSIDLAATARSNNLHLTLIGNVTSFALTNPVDGAVYNSRLIQDATGGRTFSGLPAAFKVATGSILVYSTAPNAWDFISAEWGATEGSYATAVSTGMA